MLSVTTLTEECCCCCAAHSPLDLAFAAAVATGTETATAVGSPGQSAVASAINNGQGVPPGAPITSSSNAVGTNAPAFASSISSGRKLKQVWAERSDA